MQCRRTVIVSRGLFDCKYWLFACLITLVMPSTYWHAHPVCSSSSWVSSLRLISMDCWRPKAGAVHLLVQEEIESAHGLRNLPYRDSKIIRLRLRRHLRFARGNTVDRKMTMTKMIFIYSTVSLVPPISTMDVWRGITWSAHTWSTVNSHSCDGGISVSHVVVKVR